MAAILKKQLLKKLARFTKSLSPDDIDLNLKKGTGNLRNLELDVEYISELLSLPPWLQISSATCDSIRVNVHIAKLNTKPIHIIIDSITVKISILDEMKLRQKNQISGIKRNTNSGKYGLVEKIIDSMLIDIDKVNIEFNAKDFEASLFVSDIQWKSTDHEWNDCSQDLNKSRPIDRKHETVTIFKQLSFSCIRVTAKSLGADQDSYRPIHLNCTTSTIKIANRKRLVDCSYVCSKLILHLGVVSSSLNDKQLHETSRFIQYIKQLNDLAKLMTQSNESQQYHHQQQHIATSSPPRPTSTKNSVDNSSGNAFKKVAKRLSSSNNVSPPTKKSLDTTNFIRKDESGKVDFGASVMHLQSTLIHEDEDMIAYSTGKKVLPPGLIIQTSFHFRVLKLDIHLCSHKNSKQGKNTIESTHIQFSGLGLDIYPDQKAGSYRHHWANFDPFFDFRTDWGNDLLKETEKKVSRVQSQSGITLLGISLDKLRESVACLRCIDFSISPVSNDEVYLKKRAFIASDKSSYKFNSDAPSIWIDFTTYFYPLDAQHKFLIPRPNIYVHLNPIQITFYQDTCIWFIQFIISLAVTIKLGENQAAPTPEKKKLGEVTLIGKNQLKGLDVRINALMTKITLPITYPAEVSNNKNRPVGVQLDASEIIITNYTASDLVEKNQSFRSMLALFKKSWLYNAPPSEYPNTQDDLPIYPQLLKDIFTYMDNQNSNTQKSSSFVHVEKMKKSLLWQIELKYFSMSLVSSLSSEDVMRPDEFIEPFNLTLWLATNIISNIAPLAELGKNFSEADFTDINMNPLMYYLVHIGKPLDVNINHTVFLSIMRLKDSLKAFREQVMAEVAKLTSLKSPQSLQNEESTDMKKNFKISGSLNLDRLCITVHLPIDIKDSTAIQAYDEIPEPTTLDTFANYRTRRNSTSPYNRESGEFVSRPRSATSSSVISGPNEEEWPTIPSRIHPLASVSSSGSSETIYSDITGSQLLRFETNDIELEMLESVVPDFAQESFMASFSKQIISQAKPKPSQNNDLVTAAKKEMPKILDLISQIDNKHIIMENKVLERKDILTYVLRVKVSNLQLIPNIIGDKLNLKGIVSNLQFSEVPVTVEEYVEQSGSSKKNNSYLNEGWDLIDPTQTPVVKFKIEFGKHIEDLYKQYSPSPSIAIDSKLENISGVIFGAHLQRIKSIIKDEMPPTPTTIPITINIKNFDFCIAELPGSKDNDTCIHIDYLDVLRLPNYQLQLNYSAPYTNLANLIETPVNMSNYLLELPSAITTRRSSEDVLQDSTPVNIQTIKIVAEEFTSSMQSEFTDIEALPEYSQELLSQLTSLKLDYSIAQKTIGQQEDKLAILQNQLTEAASNFDCKAELYENAFSEVRSLKTDNCLLKSEVQNKTEQLHDKEEEINSFRMAKKSMEQLVRMKVNELEDYSAKFTTFHNQFKDYKDKIASLEMNKLSMEEILTRNLEDIQILTLQNDQLKSMDSLIPSASFS